MRNRDPQKERIVKTKAVELLVKDGFENFSVNKLARASGISVATLYIYYKDKDDLIIRIAREEFLKMSDSVMRDFDTTASFEDGLRFQWKQRSAYLLSTPYAVMFFDQLKSSSYHEKVYESSVSGFREGMEQFLRNAVGRGGLTPMPVEVFWSVAFAPLYTLLRFHHEGRSVGGKKFQLTDSILEQTFLLVLKAFKS